MYDNNNNNDNNGIVSSAPVAEAIATDNFQFTNVYLPNKIQRMQVK